ncbi:MAG TPA: hypothetical protein VLK33_06605 [Terriglobales bacterium]|nr:hypothetical protein [Terriglobales bacterium]
MSPLRTRRFQQGDELRIWEILKQMKQAHPFAKVGSLELMRWKWHNAPGGPMDSWVIENQQPDSAWKIVGHHGLCPTRFTLGEQDLLCGKTTNTMLLPEFRSRFLYLRFEQECLRESGKRFDATYSCAPGTARLRKPLGYVGDGAWIHMARGVQTPEAVSRILGFLSGRYPHCTWGKIKDAIVAISESIGRKSSLSLTEYSSMEAARAVFFKDFWNQARQYAGMSPRRDIADLDWRFWQRPDFNFSTLTHTWDGGARAYCAVNITDPLIFYLEDIFVVPPRTDLLEAFLSAIFTWCAQKGCILLRFSTTNDGQAEESLDVFTRHMYMSPLRHFRRTMDFPRRIAKDGRLGSSGNLNWNATRLLIPA